MLNERTLHSGCLGTAHLLEFIKDLQILWNVSWIGWLGTLLLTIVLLSALYILRFKNLYYVFFRS